jgi:hypothetical protein
VVDSKISTQNGKATDKNSVNTDGDGIAIVGKKYSLSLALMIGFISYPQITCRQGPSLHAVIL